MSPFEREMGIADQVLGSTNLDNRRNAPLSARSALDGVGRRPYISGVRPGPVQWGSVVHLSIRGK